jgi:hypothetical protein
MVHLEIFHPQRAINVKTWMPTMTEGRDFFYSNAIHHLAQSTPQREAELKSS